MQQAASTWAEKYGKYGSKIGGVRVKNMGRVGQKSATTLSEVRGTLRPFSRNSGCSTNFVSIPYTKFDTNLLNGRCRYQLTDRQTDTAFLVCFLKDDNFKQPGIFSFFPLELPGSLVIYNFNQRKSASSYCSETAALFICPAETQRFRTRSLGGNKQTTHNLPLHRHTQQCELTHATARLSHVKLQSLTKTKPVSFLSCFKRNETYSFK